MPADYVLIQWAEQRARARGHHLSPWEQREESAVAACEHCGRSAIVDFKSSRIYRKKLWPLRDYAARGTTPDDGCSWLTAVTTT
jgi:hypothetical protein